MVISTRLDVRLRFDVNFLVRVHPVAMLDGVDEGLFHGDAKAEEVLADDSMFFGGVENLLLYLVGLGEVGRNRESEPTVATGGGATRTNAISARLP